jgi:hypothetical protein
MVSWLTRSLVFIIAGAVLAFAVTVDHLTYRRATLDVHTVGWILLLVGIGDLLVNLAMLMYLRRPPRSVAVRRQVVHGPSTYPDLTEKADPTESDLQDTEVIRRDTPYWH